MKVLVLCTGRSGSVTLDKACQFIENYTSSHESFSRKLGEERFEFPDNHIEIDNRLSWFTGQLNEKLGDEVIYIHMKRDREKTAKSFMNRFGYPNSIIDFYSSGVKMTPIQTIGKEEKYQLCLDYVDTINSNIEFLLANKSKTLTIHLETIKEDFPKFWKLIEAKGDFEKALQQFDIKHNPSRDKTIQNLRYRIKLFFVGLFKR